jgi:L-ascorbate metabolism protein UlaG (beta-lactamase superfamily)
MRLAAIVLLALAGGGGFGIRVAPGGPGASRGSPPCEVRSLANAGILFRSGDTGVIVDGFVRDGIPPYAVPGAAERRRLEAAEPPYDRVSALLVTHWHEDHFAASAVAARLRADPRVRLVVADEVAARVRAEWPDLPAARLLAATPAPGAAVRVPLDGVTIHVLGLRHNPTRRTPEQHVGYLVEGCRTLLHVGDADPVADNFAVLRTLPRVEVAALPFWYVTGASGRALVESQIRPGRVLALHLPPGDAAQVSRQLADRRDITLLTGPGLVIRLQ